MAGIKIVNLPAVGRDLISTDLFELSLVGGSGSRKITGQEIMNASKLNVGGTPIINGTVGRILFQGASDTLGESANLFWDNTNERLGIGTSSPSAVVHSVGSVTASSLIARGNYIQPTLVPNANNSQLIGLQVDISASAGGFTNVLGWGLILGNLLDNNLRFQRTIYGTSLRNSINSYTAGTANNSLLLQDISSGTTSIGAGGGNVLINTTTDAGYKLDVNGTARVQGKLTVSTGGMDLTGTLTNYSGYQGYGQMQLFSGSAFQMFNSANNSKSSFQYTTATGLSLSINPENLSGVLNGLAIGASLVASANNQTLVGLDIQPTFTTGAFTGVRNTFLRIGTDYGAWGNGTVPNVRINANTGVYGTLQVAGDSTYLSMWGSGSPNNGMLISCNYDGPGSSLRLGSASTNHMYIMRNTGNVLINTATDAGFKLDVNGTARVSGNLTLTNGSLILSSYYTVGDGTYSLRRDYLSSYDPFRIYTIVNQSPLYLGSGTINTCVVLNGVNDTQRGFGIADDGTPSLLNSAILQLNSTKRGFLPPRMTNAQRTAIASPAVGLIVYCTDATEGLWIYKSSGWTFIV